MPPLVDLFSIAGSHERWAVIILDTAIKGALILAVAAAVVVSFRRASASVRHLAWTLAFIALCVLPAITALGPRWGVPILPASVVDPGPAPAALKPATQHPFKTEIDAEGIALGRARALAETVTTAPHVPGGPAFRTRGTMSWILFVWAAGALIVAARQLVSLIAVWFKGYRAVPIADGSWQAFLDELALGHGIRRRVSLRLTSGPAIPATWGLFRPIILLPVEAIDWPQQRLRAVLLHELAHVARADFLILTVARIACAMHWFNPLVWVAERFLRVECEQASDEMVLNAGLTPSDYATHLVEVLMAARPGREAPVGALAMGRSNGLEFRLRAILDGERPRGGLTSRRFALMALAAFCFLLPLALVRLEARAHDAPKLERPPKGMTIEVVGVSTHPSGATTWWSPDGTPLREAPCDPAGEVMNAPGRQVREVVARIVGLPEGAALEWNPSQCRSQGLGGVMKGGKPVQDLQRAVAEFANGLATCDVHFDIAVGPWTTERAFDGTSSMGITTQERAFFFGKARETAQGTAITIAHNIIDRVVGVVAIDREGHEHRPVSAGRGGAGHFIGLDIEFDIPPGQIREYQLRSRPVGRFEIKNVALQPRKP
jgi:beta-lactamase regulating signal transducer with metallopeptidase domain